MDKRLQTLVSLNARFGNDNLTFLPVESELMKAELRFAERASVQIHLQGAQVTQWTDNTGDENLFTSRSAIYQTGVPIRGGNPIIFPQFGAGAMPQHGFARNTLWRVVDSASNESATCLVLELTAADLSEKQREYWQHQFVLTLTLRLTESTLTTQLHIKNTDDTPFAFTFGFHTYLAVAQITHVEISGLSNLNYMDNLLEKQIFTEQRPVVVIDRFTDRRYQHIPDEIVLTDTATGRKLLMQTHGCEDAFVWNPWATAESSFKDLAANSYQHFVCIEPGCMKTPVVLQSAEEFVAQQHLIILPNS
jgi:glucose-6-phosphate 1-epimerase